MPGKTIIQPIKTVVSVSTTPAVTQVIQPIKAIDKALPGIITPTSSGSQQLKPYPILKPLPLPIIPLPNSPTGPVISDIFAETGSDILHITWRTNVPATSRMEYGTTAAYGKSLEDKNLTTEHSINIAVVPGVLHVRISSTDANKKISLSPDFQLTVPAPESETQSTTSTTTATEDPGVVVAIQTGLDSTNSTDTKADGSSLGLEKADSSAEQKATTTQNGISAVDAVLGGLAVLFAGMLIGVLVRKKKE